MKVFYLTLNHTCIKAGEQKDPGHIGSRLLHANVDSLPLPQRADHTINKSIRDFEMTMLVSISMN